MAKYTPLALAGLAFVSFFFCSSAPLLTNRYLFPECLLSKGFLSALPVISFSHMFYFWVALPIRVNSPVTPTQIICRSGFYSVWVFCCFPCSATFYPLTGACFQLKIHTVRNYREEVIYLDATQKRKPAKSSQN